MKEKFARWDILFFQYLKRDWKKILIWILSLGLFSSGFVPFFNEMSEGEGLIAMYETLQNPAMIYMIGPTSINSAGDYTLGAMYAHEMLLFSSLFAMIISALHVVGHTRKEEDLGLTELVRSFQIGRQANSLATIVETILINGLLALLIGSVMISFDAYTITIEGSFLFGASIGMAGILGATIALIMAQIMSSSSGATGSTLGIIGLLYIIRAGTDVTNIEFSKANPLSWTYLTFPFTENDGSFLIYAAVFCLVMVIIAFTLEGARDMGSGYLPERAGRDHANQSLLSISGLFIRLNKNVMISWLVAFAIMGAAYGSIYGDMQGFLESNELIRQMFVSTGISVEVSFTSTIMMIMIILVSILPIAVVNKLFNEEVQLHLSQIFATKVTRSHLFWTSIGLSTLAGVIGILLASLSLAWTALSTMTQQSPLNLTSFIGAGLNAFPSVLFFIGLAALTLGWAPRWGKAIYVYLGYSFLLNYFGSILDLPKWVSRSALHSWVAHMPLDSFEIGSFTVILMISLCLILIGYSGYIRRDLLEGA
ncbi:ABC-2 type transport system permease protein [Amphibacillus marinus]|uniref:ABC-2 type transport system permease protein n=1 Tax=Amphibacillus marinus TaxID=872970 RepID=A0A1H8K5V9_9BACI|nr:tetronasin resistance protein [Amphibacillus marinus]SEN88087.1 ABC-2 type transport system permease protein [Amphibacillus marinus]